MTEATRTLEKWLFYYDRFNNHEMSAKLDQELCESTAEKMIEVQESSNLSWIEVSRMTVTIANQFSLATVQVHAECSPGFDQMPYNLKVELRHGFLPCTGQRERNF